MKPTPEDFVIVWQTSRSVVEASNRLTEAGHWAMSPRRTRRYAAWLWSRGVKLTPLPMRAPEPAAPTEVAEVGKDLLGWGPKFERFVTSSPEMDHASAWRDMVGRFGYSKLLWPNLSRGVCGGQVDVEFVDVANGVVTVIEFNQLTKKERDNG